MRFNSERNACSIKSVQMPRFNADSSKSKCLAKKTPLDVGEEAGK